MDANASQQLLGRQFALRRLAGSGVSTVADLLAEAPWVSQVQGSSPSPPEFSGHSSSSALQASASHPSVCRNERQGPRKPVEFQCRTGVVCIIHEQQVGSRVFSLGHPGSVDRGG